MATLFDVIVCGGGVQGLSTANYLAEKRKNVLLIDQFPLPHTRGSSHGPSRIARYAYPTPQHAQLMAESFDRWFDLEKRMKTKLFKNCGLLTIGSASYLSKISGALKSIGKVGDHVASSEIIETYPGLRSVKFDGIYEKTAGILFADKCVRAVKSSVEKFGGIIRENEKIIKINPINAIRVEVHTDKEVYVGKSVVLTCGSWTNKLLEPLNLHLPIKPLLIRVCYWKAKDPELYSSDRFPSVIIDDDIHIYSTPVLEYPGLMKVCYHYGTEIDPDQRDLKLTPENKACAEKQERKLVALIKEYYPNLVPVPSLEESCIYSNTPDSDYILDRHPEYQNIIIGAGFSGHGFKCAPVIGRILGDMATGIPPAYDLGAFSMARFRKSNL